jgi:uncharacterized membrane protein
MSGNLFMYAGTYADEGAARADHELVKALHAEGDIGSYDSAVITKDSKDKVHVEKDEMATRHGAWGGLAVGALVGIVFPPSVVGSALVGAAAGGVGGHLWRGMSRSDMKDIGELLDEGESALVVVGQDRIADAIDRLELHANKVLARDLEVDADDFDAEVRHALDDDAT